MQKKKHPPPKNPFIQTCIALSLLKLQQIGFKEVKHLEINKYSDNRQLFCGKKKYLKEFIHQPKY